MKNRRILFRSCAIALAISSGVATQSIARPLGGVNAHRHPANPPISVPPGDSGEASAGAYGVQDTGSVIGLISSGGILTASTVISGDAVLYSSSASAFGGTPPSGSLTNSGGIITADKPRKPRHR